MPVHELSSLLDSPDEPLVRELAAEWISAKSDRTEPIIWIERSPLRVPSRVYVVWSQWRSIEHSRRSSIIMQAARRVLQPLESIGISLAMGLLPEEAKALGINKAFSLY